MSVLRFWPFAVPVVYFAVIVAVQPAGVQVPPGGTVPGYPLSGGFARDITDDSDTCAWVLRAENTARGRKAGHPTEPPEVHPHQAYELTHYAPDSLGAAAGGVGMLEARPPGDRYFLEYPPAALYFFRLGLIGSGRPSADEPLNPALLDSHQYNVSHHVPQTPTETSLFAAFRHAQRVYAGLLLAALIGTMLLVRHGVGANGTCVGPAWLLVLPGTLYFTPCRFDILPAALVLAAVALTDRKQPLLGAGLLGLAVALKTYPLVLAPLVLRHAAKTWVGALLWCVAFGVVPVAFNVSLFLTDGIEAITAPLAFQANRTPHPEWVFYGRLFPTLFAFGDLYGQLFRAVPMLLVVGLLSVKRSADADALLRRCAVAVILFVSLQVIFSPQWWIWIATLLVPLSGKRRWLVAAVAAGEVLTYATFPLLFDAHAFQEMDDGLGIRLREASVWIRAALWFGIAAMLVREEGKAVSRTSVGA